MKSISSIFLFFITLSLTITSFVVAPTNAFACSPSPSWPPTLQENYETHTHIFAGSVIGITEDSENRTIAITFDPLVVAKGSGDIIVNEPFTVTAASSSAGCGYDNGDELFTEGSLWVIYTGEAKSITHLSLNKEVSTLEEAELLFQESVRTTTPEEEPENPPVICTADYTPVCGQIDTGIRCITTPCPSFEEKTFSNKCNLMAAKAEFLYEGECVETEDEIEIIPTPGKEEEVLPPTVITEPTEEPPTAEEILEQIQIIEDKIETLENIDTPEVTSEPEKEEGFFKKIGGFFKKVFFFWK